MSTVLSILKFIRHRFDLSEDQREHQETVTAIRQGIEFRGTNLWTLIFAILVASAGLNINSTAVVIGAMLISPLMGPIMGVGLGVGIYDFELIKQAGKNLLIMMVVSILASTLYFLISPLKEAQSELLGRTTPTIWDVMIAFSGGMAGIIAATRKSGGNVVAGVAIATALMPPLCTAGYALSIGNGYYFLGAFYLFSINTVFISFSTLVVVRVLNFPRTKFVSLEMEKSVRRNVTVVVILTVLPSIVMGWYIVRKTIFQSRVETFVKEEFKNMETQVLRTEEVFTWDGKGSVCLYTVGDEIDSIEQQNLVSHLPAYGLNRVSLELRQGTMARQKTDVGLIRIGILEDLYERNEKVLQEKDEELIALRKELDRYQLLESESSSIAAELKTLEPSVAQFSINSNIYYDFKANQNDTIPVAYIRYGKKLTGPTKERLYNWLKLRTASDTLILIQQ
jgi:uncharacterized hydrophobic protein (TIGR00271 family)